MASHPRGEKPSKAGSVVDLHPVLCKRRGKESEVGSKVRKKETLPNQHSCPQSGTLGFEARLGPFLAVSLWQVTSHL